VLAAAIAVFAPDVLAAKQLAWLDAENELALAMCGEGVWQVRLGDLRRPLNAVQTRPVLAETRDGTRVLLADLL